MDCDAMLASHNVGPASVRARIAASVSADRKFALARAYQSAIAVAVTPTQRDKAISAALEKADAADASDSLYVTFAAWWR
jgi:hypothetical protein